MTEKTNETRPIAVIDFETDPFAHGRVPKPFAAGFMQGVSCVTFVGPYCAGDLVAHLQTIKVPLLIYAHNGGKFDFYFLHPWFSSDIKLINGRIVSVKIGIHELRDSWSIIPIPLAVYKKTEIDYAKFEAGERHKHMPEILRYLRDDCADLLALCTAFVERFGPRLTIAGTAMHELVSICPQSFNGESHDKRFRLFYFGGRVECFASGVLTAPKGRPWRVYDVNSMYPSVMKNADHPIGKHYVYFENPLLDGDQWIEGAPGRMYFCEVTGVNYGALPVRGADGSLDFSVGFGTFLTTSHELRVAVALGRFEVVELHRAWVPRQVQTFGPFVDKWSGEKILAKRQKDKIAEIFAKLILNSAYGKFGQNPANYKEWLFQVRGKHPYPNNGKAGPWQLEQSAPEWCVWSKPAKMFRYFDVAVAASVTSAARAVLLRGLAGATNAIYCDTDSIICERLSGVEIDSSALGAWKLEASGTRAAIAGKKLYALFDSRQEVKSACKGVKLSGRDIAKIAKGGEVLWESEAPSFNLSGNIKFISRKTKKTA